MMNRRNFLRATASGLLVPAAMAQVAPNPPAELLVDGRLSPAPPPPAPSSGDTALARAFAELAEGEDANYAAGKCPESIGFIGPSQGVLDWSAIFHHDATRKEIQVLGKVQQPYGTARHIMFSETSQTWRIVDHDMWGSSALGHPYYAKTLDTTTGDMYYVLWSEDRFRRYTRSTDAWDRNTKEDNEDWQGSPPVGCAFHPTLFPARSNKKGIVVWARAHFFVYSLEDESGQRINASSLGDHGDSGGIVYSPAINAVVAGSGDDIPLRMYRIDPGNPPTYTRIADLPYAVRANGRYSVLTTHPINGRAMIIERNMATGSKVHVYNHVTDRWELQPYTHPFGGLPSSSASSPQFIVCTFAAYHGVGALYQNGGGAHAYDLNFHIWKTPA